jgi:hypothetical protein
MENHPADWIAGVDHESKNDENNNDEDKEDDAEDENFAEDETNADVNPAVNEEPTADNNPKDPTDEQEQESDDEANPTDGLQVEDDDEESEEAPIKRTSTRERKETAKQNVDAFKGNSHVQNSKLKPIAAAKTAKKDSNSMARKQEPQATLNKMERNQEAGYNNVEKPSKLEMSHSLTMEEKGNVSDCERAEDLATVIEGSMGSNNEGTVTEGASSEHQYKLEKKLKMIGEKAMKPPVPRKDWTNQASEIATPN